MALNQAEIKRAISLLSTVGDEDISNMEPEFFAAYARFSETYKNHIEKTVAKDNAVDWAISRLPPCPKCGSRSPVLCVPMIQYANFYASTYKDSKQVDVSIDYFDSDFYTSKDYQEFFNLVKERIPEMAYLVQDHLSCSECQTSYAPGIDLNPLYSEDIDFKTIVDWVNRGKPNVEVDNVSE